jgi:hypothetical protein
MIIEEYRGLNGYKENHLNFFMSLLVLLLMQIVTTFFTTVCLLLKNFIKNLIIY